MTLLALAIAPGLVICFYIFYKDMYNPEPIMKLVISFILGALVVIPAAVIEQAATRYFDNTILSTGLFAYGVVALTEETGKFMVLRYYAYPKQSFDEPLDGIVYGIMASMGFATVENILYVSSNGFGTAIIRMFLSVPAHATFAVLMGYYAGKAKFNPNQSFALLLTGLLAAIFFHGTFDFLLFLQKSPYVQSYVSDGLLFLGAIGSFFVAIRLSKRLIRQHQELSKQTFSNISSGV
ncbi:MAG: PrsW family glutamic-type intramembrane protease [Bacteroidota bacterium]